MNRRVISWGFVEDAVECLRNRAIDPAEALNRAQISSTSREKVTSIQYGQLWIEVSRTIEDEFFGLGGRPMRPGSFNMLCHALVGTENLEHAIRRGLKFLAIVLDDPVGELRHRNGLAEITLTDKIGRRSAFAYRTYWLLLLGVTCWLIGRRIALRQVDFACTAPSRGADYRQFFGAPVHFDKPFSRLTFNTSCLSLPTIRNEASVSAFLKGSPANILIRYRQDQGTSVEVRRLFKETPTSRWPDFDKLAARMKMSPATLRRRLLGEGQSFSVIRDELRYNLACELLSGEAHTIAQIASLLGYAESSAFHRAFAKWSGNTPSAYRRMALA
ncbi:AraC family transcriptional regulator (plasmid) [Rhizobium sp. CB3060]|nr:AraC family transcriptional regulator [Rhizobium tropici]